MAGRPGAHRRANQPSTGKDRGGAQGAQSGRDAAPPADRRREYQLEQRPRTRPLTAARAAPAAAIQSPQPSTSRAGTPASAGRARNTAAANTAAAAPQSAQRRKCRSTARTGLAVWSAIDMRRLRARARRRDGARGGRGLPTLTVTVDERRELGRVPADDAEQYAGDQFAQPGRVVGRVPEQPRAHGEPQAGREDARTRPGAEPQPAASVVRRRR